MLDPFIEGTDLEGGNVSESLAVLSFLLMRLLGMEKPEDEYVAYVPARHQVLHWSSPYLLVRPTPRKHGIAGGWHIPSSLLSHPRMGICIGRVWPPHTWSSLAALARVISVLPLAAQHESRRPLCSRHPRWHTC